MDPHHVPHMFNWTAHPTDLLLPVNLWDKSVKTILELSLLDPSKLGQMRMVDGIQQNVCTITKSVYTIC